MPGGFAARLTSLGQRRNFAHQDGASGARDEFYMLVLIPDFQAGMDSAVIGMPARTG
jgi:hypothetical protein